MGRFYHQPVITGKTTWHLRLRSRFLPAVAIVVWRQRWRVLRCEIDIFGEALQVRFHQRFFVMLFCNEHVKRWNNEQSENRSDCHSANEHKTDRISRRGAVAGHERERKVTGDSCDARHPDRTQTYP